MEELIKKHLGINTPQWIIDNCKALLIEWDSLKGDTSERQLIIPDVRVHTYITCSAIWFKDGIKHDHQPFNIETGFVICGHRHHNCFMTAYILNDNEKVKGLEEIQGFMTSENNFVDRKEGGQIAFKAGQTSEFKTRLFSEDLY